MENSQLVFIPSPFIGHLISMVEFSKLLLRHDVGLSITIIVIKPSCFDSNILENYTHSVPDSSTDLSSRIRFVHLPKDEQSNSESFDLPSFVERQKPHVKEAVSMIIQSDSDSSRLAGFVLDMFCSAMIDVANDDFGVPSYIFFTSGAAFLGFTLHMLVICDEQNVTPTELMESGTELEIPCLVNPFPAKFMPSTLLSKEGPPQMLEYFRRFKEAKGVIVNTFFELEPYAIESVFKGKFGNISIVYPVGPILNVGYDHQSSNEREIILWLDHQPASSVVFLCFGSMGSFDKDQVREIAYALEHSGVRFLWSLRRPPPTGKKEYPKDYENVEKVLPKGFLDRKLDLEK